jgi:hypothetical protein
MREGAARKRGTVAAVASRTVVDTRSSPAEHRSHAEQGGISLQCAVLAFVGLAAVAIGMALPLEDRGPTPGARATAPAPQPASGAAMQAHYSAGVMPEQEAAFEYFPAQFPTPRGEIEEQPATF